MLPSRAEFAAVWEKHSCRETARYFGLNPNFTSQLATAWELPPKRITRRWTKEEWIERTYGCTSVAEVCTRLGLSPVHVRAMMHTHGAPPGFSMGTYGRNSSKEPRK